jgi:hypothetical protein
MHRSAFTAFDDFQATSETTFQDAGDVGQAVNPAMCTEGYWLIGREIVQDAKSGDERAE